MGTEGKPRLVQPTTYKVGATAPSLSGIHDYLKDTGQLEFANDWMEAGKQGVEPGERLCSMYAKMCYASLVTGKNVNITKTRPIKDNVIATLDHGHGSVFEHVQVNFITTNCSRVFTHELVRHRAGTAFSQTSGRYVRTDTLQIAYDPILDPVKDQIIDGLVEMESWYNMLAAILIKPEDSFEVKKKKTSALRRLLPNGQVNEIGWSMNLRAARHMIQLRTSRHAEWEIRLVFNQVYEIMKKSYPLMFHDAKEEMVDGLLEITGMKTQPY